MKTSPGQPAKKISTAERGVHPDHRGGSPEELPGDDASWQTENAQSDAQRTMAVVNGRATAFETTAPTLGPGADAPARSHEPLRIGSYRIVGVLGEGSMGVVYRAEQDNPSRPVALKVLKAGGTSARTLQRLEHEAQVLGRLQHPGIAQIFEAGTAELDYGLQPFFAMELVRGAPLIDYADENALNHRDRLELLMKVCDGVHHAHQKGVIHRDLKPGNIIVDQSGQPKILDFGIALVTAQATTSSAGASPRLESAGTVPYMSYEQLMGDTADLDTRTDVYALGVIAFQLLTGRLPHDLSHETIREAAKIVGTHSPRRLGTYDKKLRGDLEYILAKAIHRHKESRYQSATDFAADIRRYLSNEAIVARPPSAAYQFRIFVRRNRVLLGAISAVFVALTAGVVVSTSMYLRAKDASAKAEGEASTVIAINNFLVNGLIASADPETALSREITVADVLKNAAEKIESAFPNRPDIEASIRRTIGQTYQSLGQLELAERQVLAALEKAEAAFGNEHPKTLELMNDLVGLQAEQGKLPEAESLCRQTLLIQQRVQGNEHPNTLETQNNLALVLSMRGGPKNLAEAESLHRHTLAADRRLFGDEHKKTLIAMNNLALILRRRDEPTEASRLYRETLAIQRRELPDGHPDTMTTIQNLAYVLTKLSQLAEAEQLYREVIETRRPLLGPIHPKTINSVTSLAKLLTTKKDYQGAESLYRDTVARVRKELPKDDPRLASALIRLGLFHLNQGNAATAEPLLRECLDIRSNAFKAGDWRTANAESALGMCLNSLGRYREAEPLLIESYASYRAALGDSDEYTERGLRRIIELYDAWEKSAKAAKYRVMSAKPESE